MARRILKLQGKEYYWNVRGDTLCIWNQTDHKPVGKWSICEDAYDGFTVPIGPFDVRRLIEGDELFQKIP